MHVMRYRVARLVLSWLYRDRKLIQREGERHEVAHL